MLVPTGLEPPTSNGGPGKPAMLTMPWRKHRSVAATGEPVYTFVDVVLRQIAVYDFETVDQKQLHTDLNVVLNITGWEIDQDGWLYPRSAVQQMVLS